MKQLLPKLKKINCKKLISKKKSQIDRATGRLIKSCTCLYIFILWRRVNAEKLE